MKVNTNLRPRDLGSLAVLYVSAEPYALVTPAGSQDRNAVAPFPDEVTDAVPEPAPVKASSDLLAEYVHLHETRMERAPEESPRARLAAPS